ncbi:hypothetical protein Hanom_Chr10g00947141 [Helianthus anomalus]
MASSQVGEPVDPGNQGEFYVEDEELCMGNGSLRDLDLVRSLPNDGGEGVGPNEVRFNWQPFLDSCAGKVPNPSGKEKVGIHFFKASKRAKRYRKGAPKCQQEVSGGSPIFVLDSSDKSRTKKRNRVPVEESSDPFSLDNLFELMKNKGGGGGSGNPPVSMVNLNQPLNSVGVLVVDEEGVNEVESSQAQGFRSSGSRDPADLSSVGGSFNSGDSVDVEIRETVKLGVKLGMEVGNSEELVRKEVVGKGINVVKL